MPLMTTLDSELSTEPLESLTDELGSIVMDNSLRYTKTVDDVMFNEFDHTDDFTSFKGMASAHLEK